MKFEKLRDDNIVSDRKYRIDMTQEELDNFLKQIKNHGSRESLYFLAELEFGLEYISTPEPTRFLLQQTMSKK